MSAILVYCYDPMCSWCWAFSPTWHMLKTNLTPMIDKGKLSIRPIVGGLAIDSDEPMPMPMQEKLQAVWKHIESQVGTQFNHDFWQQCKPRRSTYPACRACLVARAEGLEMQMIEQIQHAYYLHASNPSDLETLVGCGEKIGIEKERFTAAIENIKDSEQLELEIHQARQLGLNSFPSLAVLNNDRIVHISINYNNTDSMYAEIQQVLA